MQVTVAKLSDVVVTVNVEIPVGQVDAEIEKAYAEIRKTAKMEGFRPGKVPMQLVKSAYRDTMREKVVRHLCETTFSQAVAEQKLIQCSIPTFKCDLLEQGTPFKYSAMFEVMPEICVKDYTELPVTKKKHQPDPELVEAELRRMQSGMAELIPVGDDDAVGNDHTVFFDYTFSVEGHPDMDASAKGAMLETGTGSERIWPGFEEQLIGMKRGESKEIRVPQPAAAEGREGVFQVTVTDIRRKELPELDDEFAKRCGEYETMEALREKMTAYFREQESDRIEFELHERLIKAMIERNPLEVPQAMVNAHLDHMLESYKHRLESNQEQLAEFDEEGFRERLRNSAEKKVKGDLLLMALVEKEHLVATDEDLARRYEEIAAGDGGKLEEVRKYYASNSQAMDALLTDIKMGKAIGFLQDHAVITEVEPAEAPAS